MERRHYVSLRRRHDIPTRLHEDVPLKPLGDVSLRRRWVFHLRLRWDVQRDVVTTSPRRLRVGSIIRTFAKFLKQKFH